MPTADSNLMLLPWMGLAFLVLYLTSIRPQRKQQKARRALLDRIQEDDWVRLDSGICGRVIGLQHPYLYLEFGRNTFVPVHVRHLEAVLPHHSFE